MCRRGHFFLFFNTEMKPFDPGFGSPKMENVSSCTMFLLSLNFQLMGKDSETEKKNPNPSVSFFFSWDALQKNLDALSLPHPCCGLTVSTLDVFASSVGTPACPNNATVGAFHFVHTTLAGRLLD